ncbi:hypothetical protein [Vibrio rarus]|uniref:type IV pilus modification PilV family protein n=1 Tax=Vibrio rarus TaxID=413403 RepID=UPI0021C3C012|nr:hypothetical protein [Vibrio rarus]
MTSSKHNKGHKGSSMLEVLVATALVALFSLFLIEGGVYLQRETHLATQRVQVLAHMENQLEKARVKALTGTDLESHWPAASLPFSLTVLHSDTVSSQGVKGRQIMLSASWSDPWGEQQQLSIKTWVVFNK